MAKIKKVELIYPDGNWTLSDTNDYPLEIYDGDWAFTYNGTDKLDVDVVFAPADTGVSTAQLKVTWGLYEDKIYYVDLSGEGLSCYLAEEAFPGENWATSRNSWFTYTADKFQLVYINTCHPNNFNNSGSESYDTWLGLFTDCEGNYLINCGWDWDSCAYNKIYMSRDWSGT